MLQILKRLTAKKQPARPDWGDDGRAEPRLAEPAVENRGEFHTPGVQQADLSHSEIAPESRAEPGDGVSNFSIPLSDKDADVAPSSGTQEQEVGEEGVLIVKGIGKSFGRKRVVESVSLHVRRGESVGLLGPNGAGKTTVFYMITGLVTPDHGEINLDGYNITKLPMYQRARLGIGYLPQEASIFRGLTVEENIRAVLEIVEKDKARRQHDLDSLLNEFRIDHLRKSPAIALSGGERRRCEIARSLASRPSFMLLDEPFAGIDPIAVGDIQNLVRHLTKRGIGVLITDHNVRETLGLIDRAYIIASGAVLTEGLPNDIVANKDVRRLYLGEQFTL